MNRELKFRVWNIIESRWNGAYNQEPKMVGELCCHKGIYLIPESASRNLITQQYTGLKDKNGVEIYEGDILERIYDVSCFKLKNGEILEGCEPGNFMVKKSVLSEVKWSGIGFDLGVKIQIGWHKKNTLKVIGNIFENSELLKQ